MKNYNLVELNRLEGVNMEVAVPSKTMCEAEIRGEYGNGNESKNYSGMRRRIAKRSNLHCVTCGLISYPISK